MTERPEPLSQRNAKTLVSDDHTFYTHTKYPNSCNEMNVVLL